jgi:uracil-DNA glycosylase
MHESWKKVLNSEIRSSWFHELADKVAAERRDHVVYPPTGKVFTAFEITPFDQVRVVIVGQDPYPGTGFAHGLSFSVPKGVEVPASLRNIYRELETDLPGFKAPKHGCLVPWAEQGVLLLNTVLTVQAGKPASHRDLGWQQFTGAVLEKLVQKDSKIVFLLWGRHARDVASDQMRGRHVVLEAAHPSPFSASDGFFGCKHFSKANAALVEAGLEPIRWELD